MMDRRQTCSARTFFHTCTRARRAASPCPLAALSAAASPHKDAEIDHDTMRRVRCSMRCRSMNAPRLPKQLIISLTIFRFPTPAHTRQEGRELAAAGVSSLIMAATILDFNNSAHDPQLCARGGCADTAWWRPDAAGAPVGTCVCLETPSIRMSVKSSRQGETCGQVCVNPKTDPNR